MQNREVEQRECVMTEVCTKSPLGDIDENSLLLDVRAFPELCCDGDLEGLPRLYLPLKTTVIPPKFPLLGNWTGNDGQNLHGYICEGPMENLRHPKPNASYKQSVTTAEISQQSGQETFLPIFVKLLIQIYMAIALSKL